MGVATGTVSLGRRPACRTPRARAGLALTVIAMGCGDACPVFPGKRYQDWDIADPQGLGTDAVRPIRDEIERRLLALLSEFGVPAGGVS